MRSEIACMLGAVLVSACAERAAEAAPSAVRDSVGVQIVEAVGAVLHPAPWLLGDAPLLTIGQTEGDPTYAFDRVVGAFRLSDGRIVVGDGGSGEVRIFDRDGRFVSVQSGNGEGPDEFQYLRALGRCRSDGFDAFDIDWAMKVYAEDGSFVEGRPRPHPDAPPPSDLVCDAAGRFAMLARTPLSGPLPSGLFEEKGRLLVAGSDGGTAAGFGEQLIGVRLVEVSPTAVQLSPHPFGRATVFDLHEGRLYLGTAEQNEVRVFGLDGVLQRILRGPALDLGVTEAMRQAHLKSVLTRTPEERKAATRARIEAWLLPPTRPAYTDLRVDPAGVTWLRGLDAAGGPERWMLIDPAVGYVGDFQLPAGQTVLSVGMDEIIVLAKDEFDVERVQVYALIR